MGIRIYPEFIQHAGRNFASIAYSTNCISGKKEKSITNDQITISVNERLHCIIFSRDRLASIKNFGAKNLDTTMAHKTLISKLRPPPYVLHSTLISIGGLLFGLDTGCIGPITTMPQFEVSFGGSLSASVHGLIVSTILIPAAIASFFAGPLADTVGRRRGVSIGGVIFALGAALEAGSNHLAMLIVGRIVAGIGEGLFLSPILVYVCEVAPPRERGVLANIQQFLTTVGICAGYFICYGTVRLAGSSFGWRIPFVCQAAIALGYAIAAWRTLPESPRWLEMKGRSEEARRTWEILGVSGAESEKVDEQQQQAAASSSSSSSSADVNTLDPDTTTVVAKQKVHALLRVFQRDVRTRTLLGVFMSGFQQLSGIDGVLYYAPLLFSQAGLTSSQASFLASGVSGLLMMLVTVPAFLLADRWGRRTSTIVGGMALATCMLVIGSLYAANTVYGDRGAARWVVIVLIYIFALVYCMTWAVGVRVHASEIQPRRTKATATGLSQTSNWTLNWIVAFTTPIFLSKSSFGVYFLFGGCILFMVAVCATMMPETMGRSLEEIDAAFDRHRDANGHGVPSLVEDAGRLWAGWRIGAGKNATRTEQEEIEMSVLS
jgi:sugar porter (SP) family MFS transporter